MSLYSKLKSKTEEASKEASKKGCMKNRVKNSIVEHIVSLSGQQTKKVYIKLGLLGRGGFANCYITQKKGSEKLMATKVIDKANLKSNRTKMRLMNEIRIHKTFQHPNIVQFYHHFQDQNNVYIMLELCENESLNELMKERISLTWPQVQSFTFGICKGVKYLHQKKYIHRDLKLGNIFLNEKYQIKIGDFGLTSQLQFLKQNKRTVCGTPNYIAPQVLEGTGYYFQIDVWAIGIIIYTLFYGFPPFQSENTPEIYHKIRSCQYKFPKKPEIPIQATQLIKSILVPNPLDRPSIQQILQSSFMKMGRGPLLELPQSIYMSPPTKKNLDTLPVANLKSLPLSELNLNTIVPSEKKEKSTLDQTFSINQTRTTEDVFSNSHSLPSHLKSVPSKQQESKMALYHFPEVYLLELELAAQNAYYFRTNQNIIGIYEKDREICYRNYSDFQKNSIGITIIPLFNNLFGEKKVTLFSEYKFKNILNFKAKQVAKSIRSEKQQTKGVKLRGSIFEQEQEEQRCQNKIYNLTKVNKFKDVFMARLSNKSIQLIFQDLKDGFLYQTKTQRLFYFDQNLLSKHDILSFKEIKVESLMDTVKNFIQNTKNAVKTPNIVTIISLINGKTMKMPINKLKHVYGLIGELKNKKTRHGNTRCSQ